MTEDVKDVLTIALAIGSAFAWDWNLHTVGVVTGVVALGYSITRSLRPEPRRQR